MYHIIDFRAIAKWAYYGADKSEAIHCEATDRHFPQWENGASGILTRVIRRILESGEGPRETIVVHDMGKAYRTGIFPGYKKDEKREAAKSPVEIEQVDKVFDWGKKWFMAFGATQIGVQGVEADDVIAWLRQGIKGPVTIHTVDADLLRLVDDDTCVYLKGEPFFGEGDYSMGEASVPYHLTSLAKSMLGDSSDKYIGVKGFGPTAWNRLRENFGDDGLEELQAIIQSGDTKSLDEAIEGSDDKDLKKLRDAFGEWRLGWRLADLHPELCWKPRTKKLTKPLIHKRIASAPKAFELLGMIGCKDMWEEFEHLFPEPFAVTSENWEEYREAIFKEIVAGDIVAFDYEGHDTRKIAEFRAASARGNNFVDMLSQSIDGCSFQFGRHLENVIYIPTGHRDSPNLPKEVIVEILKFAQEKGIQLVAHNAYFEGVVTLNDLGLDLKNVMDTRVMKRYYDENTTAGLKFCSLEYLGYQQASYEETLAAAGASDMSELTLDQVFTYGADDALVTGHLFDLFKLLLMLDGMWDFYCAAAVRPTEVLRRAYIDGVNINWALQRRIHERDLDIIDTNMKELRALLMANVTGNITEGCKSLIEAEKEYIYRKAKRSAEGDSSAANEKLYAWRKELEQSCQYIPYREEEVMPAFAFTEKQLSAAAVAVGLPELTSLSQKGWEAYLTQIGALGFEEGWELKGEQAGAQADFVRAVNKAMYLRVDKLSDLLKKSQENPDDEQMEARYQAAAEYKEELGKIIQKLAGVEPRIVTFGDPLNVGSPQQMQRLLYCKIGVPVRLRGKAPGKGRIVLGVKEAGPSTDEKAIETAIANDIKEGSWQHQALKLLLKVKSATTRCSLYHDKLPLWRHFDGKVHPMITDFGTDTGRPTATSPNVLQVSKKDKEMRSMYIPPNRDYVCVAIDFNGQEIRLMANLANDPVMLSVYDPANEKDLHSMTGSGIAKMSYEEFVAAKDDEHHELNKLTIAIRKKAKGVNFGMAYGAGPGTLSRNLIVPIEEAKKLLDDTFSLYTRIRPWQEETAEFMNKHGYTLTAFGTKRHATSDIFSNDNGKVSRQHRQGTNATIQKTAAEMLRIVLTGIAESGMLDRLRMSFFAPIYDEIVAWVHKDDVLQYVRETGKLMEESTPPGHVVRQVPEYSIGPDWGRVHELGRDISPENVAKFVQRSLEEAKDIWDVDVLQPFNPIRKAVLIEKDEDDDDDDDMEEAA